MDMYLYDWTSEDFEELRQRREEKEKRANEFKKIFDEDDEIDFF